MHTHTHACRCVHTLAHTHTLTRTHARTHTYLTFHLSFSLSSGGKTAHIASRMQEIGTLVALERSASRAQKLQEFLKQLGHVFVKVHKMDASKAMAVPGDPPPKMQKGQKTQTVRFPAESFDRILLDAPCTGLGQRPRTVNEISFENLNTTPRIQKKLFATALQLLKPGGVMTYSTCTINPAENEGIVAWALEHYECLQLCTPALRLGLPGLSNQGLPDAQCALVQRFDPRDAADTIGFFVATFKKVTDGAGGGGAGGGGAAT